MNISVLRRGGVAAAVAVTAGAIALAGTLPASAAASAPARAAGQAGPAAAARPAVAARAAASRHKAHQARKAHRARKRPAGTDWVHAVVLVNCQHRAVILPHSFVLTCADANDALTSLSWVSWRNVAFGSGTERVNSCIPSCAAGHFHSYHALITLWRPRARGHGTGQLKFTRLTEVYTGARPVRFTAGGKRHRPGTFTWHVRARGKGGAAAGGSPCATSLAPWGSRVPWLARARGSVEGHPISGLDCPSLPGCCRLAGLVRVLFVGL